MARTRASDIPDRNHAARRNPRRASQTQIARPSRTSSRSHPKINYGENSSSEEDDSTPSVSSAEDPESDLDSEGIADEAHFGSCQRPNTCRTTTKALPDRRGSLRSAHQATTSQATNQSPVTDQDSSKRPRQGIKKRPSRSSRGSNSLKKRRVAQESPELLIPQGVIPDWCDPQMPYGAWVDTFYYAATTGGYDTLDVNWLLNVATTCKAFLEPALSAIYRCPPITTSGKAKRLASLLERLPSETRLNYRAKIESLYIDVQVVPQAVLHKIVHPLPRLKEVVFFTQHDQPPYRELDRTIRWHYSEDIFRALMPSTAQLEPTDEKPYHTMLKSWEWSGRLLGGHVATINDIARVHQDPAFAHLTQLSFTNFQVPSLYKPRPKPGEEEKELELYNEDGALIDSIAEAISKLQSLKHLVFESSTVMNHRMLPLLPKSLAHLGLINCWEVKSEDLEPFLHSHGRHLRSLVLSHNQSLDMGFLTTLGDACPGLEELRMNLSYFRLHDSLSLVNNDADPMYEHALLPHQTPKWPASIRVLDFEHIRHWSVETAEMFLQSLIDNAGNLSNLRHLAVKTMLNIPWKARANMRHEWRKRLDKVFLRPFEPPKNHTSLRQPPIEQRPDSPPQEVVRRNISSDGPSISRRSTRIAAQTSDSDSQNSNNSKDPRSTRHRPTYRDPDTDEDEFDNSEDTDSELKEGGTASPIIPIIPIMQGLCKTVAIVFDNQKPTELQFGMEDFMDEDRSESDGEWDGDQDEYDEPTYAW